MKHVKLDPDKLHSLGGFFPQTSVERLFWVLSAFTAGFCEEFVYRGFGIFTLTSKELNKFVALVIISVPFVLIHGQASIESSSAFLYYLIFGLLMGLIFLWTILLPNL